MTGGPPRPRRTVPDLIGVPAAVAAMLLMLVTLPVSLPVALLLGRLDDRRLRAATVATPCGRCGALLGPDAPTLSDAAHMAALADMQRQYPFHLVHVARRAQARCPACGADHAWNSRHRTLRPLSDPA